MPEGPLGADAQKRGRTVAILSHPFSMTWRMAITGGLATQALVTLGASETAIGIQAALGALATLVQLPGLRLMSRVGKRNLLLATQVVALIGGVPLLWYADLRALGTEQAVPLALISLGVATLALVLGSTAWWPLLHGFVRPKKTGRFFAALRTLWHVALIAYFLFSTLWLRDHPGDFGLLFGVAFGCGFIRVLLLPFFPERPEREPSRVRETLAYVLREKGLRRYLYGVILDRIVYRCVPAFAIVMLRRELSLSESQTLVTTLAIYVGGLLALYPAGRLSDKLGSRPVLIWTSLLRALLVGSLGAITLLDDQGLMLAAAAAVFLAYSFLSAAFGVAEVKTLFRHAADADPSAVIVAASVIRSVIAGAAPLAVGLILDRLLDTELDRLSVYAGFFGLAAIVQAAAAVPFMRRDPTAT